MFRKLPETGVRGALGNLHRIHDKSWVIDSHERQHHAGERPPQVGRGDRAFGLCPGPSRGSFLSGEWGEILPHLPHEVPRSPVLCEAGPKCCRVLVAGVEACVGVCRVGDKLSVSLLF